MKREPHQKEKKGLSTKGLLSGIRRLFEKSNAVQSMGSGRRQKISTSDCLMSALAMFGLKSPSLLAFDLQRQEKMLVHNLEKLYEIQNIPSDTYMFTA